MDHRYARLWKSLLPPRFNIFMWMLIKDCLPTLDNIHHRLPDRNFSQFCTRCDNGETENTQHQAITCTKSITTWIILQNKFKLNLLVGASWWSSPQSHPFLPGNYGNLTLLTAITLWEIWSGRNGLTFRASPFIPDAIASSATMETHLTRRSSLGSKADGLRSFFRIHGGFLFS